MGKLSGKPVTKELHVWTNTFLTFTSYIYVKQIDWASSRQKNWRCDAFLLISEADGKIYTCCIITTKLQADRPIQTLDRRMSELAWAYGNPTLNNFILSQFIINLILWHQISEYLHHSIVYFLWPCFHWKEKNIDFTILFASSICIFKILKT